ncbi:hypothetical protein H696_04365 [Fonticula alba]|uniref:RING-type domain-containing protein n=1 Tax=Fonticula alba TaxID=691883 RepID=A0A058Z499_FONAL|nr:hypothetical protein H696_04365 [Fonticula alba]KCV68946.1 hypothetical protein H696_04365 [Fonticula alba]|eukprot:XP_009496517.1 hypothetical protein H696_04365 [Fonticula alba]
MSHGFLTAAEYELRLDRLRQLLCTSLREFRCVICLSTLSDAHYVPCGHYFCKSPCLERAVIARKECSICRTSASARAARPAPTVVDVVASLERMQAIFEDSRSECLSQTAEVYHRMMRLEPENPQLPAGPGRAAPMDLTTLFRSWGPGVLCLSQTAEVYHRMMRLEPENPQLPAGPGRAAPMDLLSRLREGLREMKAAKRPPSTDEPEGATCAEPPAKVPRPEPLRPLARETDDEPPARAGPEVDLSSTVIVAPGRRAVSRQTGDPAREAGDESATLPTEEVPAPALLSPVSTGSTATLALEDGLPSGDSEPLFRLGPLVEPPAEQEALAPAAMGTLHPGLSLESESAISSGGDLFASLLGNPFAGGPGVSPDSRPGSLSSDALFGCLPSRAPAARGWHPVSSQADTVAMDMDPGVGELPAAGCPPGGSTTAAGSPRSSFDATPRVYHDHHGAAEGAGISATGGLLPELLPSLALLPHDISLSHGISATGGLLPELLPSLALLPHDISLCDIDQLLRDAEDQLGGPGRAGVSLAGADALAGLQRGGTPPHSGPMSLTLWEDDATSGPASGAEDNAGGSHEDNDDSLPTLPLCDGLGLGPTPVGRSPGTGRGGRVAPGAFSQNDPALAALGPAPGAGVVGVAPSPPGPPPPAVPFGHPAGRLTHSLFQAITAIDLELGRLPSADIDPPHG